MSSDEPGRPIPELRIDEVNARGQQQRIIFLETHLSYKQIAIEKMTARQTELEALLSQTEADTDALRAENCNMRTLFTTLSSQKESNIRLVKDAFEKLNDASSNLTRRTGIDVDIPLVPDCVDDLSSSLNTLLSLIKVICDQFRMAQEAQSAPKQCDLEHFDSQEISELRETVSIRAEEVRAMALRAKMAEDNVRTLTSKVENLERKNLATEKCLSDTRDLLVAKEESSKAVVEEKENNIAELKAKISEISEDAKNAEESSFILKKLQAEIQELQFNLESVQRVHEVRKSDLVTANNALQQEINCLTAQLKAEKENHIVELYNSENLCQENIRELNSQKLHLGALVAALKVDNEAVVEAAGVTVKGLEYRVSQCEQRLRGEVEKSRKLDVQLCSSSAEIAKSRSELSRMAAENHCLRDQLVSGSKRSIELQCELENTKSQIEATKHENTELRDCVRDQETVHRQCAEMLESSLRDVTNSQEEIDLLIRFHSARDKHLQTEKTRRAGDMDKIITVFLEQKAYLQNCKQQLDAAITERVAISERLTSMSETYDAEICSLQSQLQQSRADHDDERRSKISLQSRCEELNTEISGLLQALNEKEALCMELADEFDIANSESAHSASELLKISTAFNSLRQRHTDEVLKAGQLERELHDVNLRYQTLLKDMESMKEAEQNNQTLSCRLETVQKTLHAKNEELNLEIEKRKKLFEKYMTSVARVNELTNSLEESNELLSKMQEAAKKSSEALKESCKGKVLKAESVSKEMRALQKQSENDLHSFVNALEQVKLSISSDSTENTYVIPSLEGMSTSSVATRVKDSMAFIVNQFKELKDVNDTLIVLEKQSNQFAKDNATLLTEIRAVSSNLTEAECQLDRRAQEEAEMNMKIRHYQELLTNIANRLHDKEHSIEASEASQDAFFSKENSQCSKSIARWTYDINDLGDKLSEALSANASLKNEIHQVLKDREALERELHRHRLASKSLHKDLVTVMSVSDVTADDFSLIANNEPCPDQQFVLFSKTLNELASSKKSLQDELEVIKEELIKEKEAMLTVGSEKSELKLCMERSRKELSLAQNEITQLTDSLQKLRHELSQTSTSLSEEISKNENLSHRLESTLAASESRHEGDSNNLQKAHSEIATLQTCLEYVDTVVSELLVKFKDVVQESAGLKELGLNTTKNSELVSGREKDLMRALANLRSWSVSTLELLEDSRREVNKLKDVKDELTTKNEKHALAIQTRETELQEARANLENLHSNVQRLKQESDASVIRFENDAISLRKSLDSAHEKNVLQVQEEAEEKLRTLKEGFKSQMAESKVKLDDALENLRTIAGETSHISHDSLEPQSVTEHVISAFKSLKSSVLDKDCRLRDIEHKHEITCGELAELKLESVNTLNRHEKDMSALRDSHNAAISKLELEAKNELEMALSGFGRLRTELEEKIQHLSNRVSELDDEADKSRCDLKARVTVIESLTKDKEKLSEDLRRLGEERDSLHSRMTELNRQYDEELTTLRGLNSNLSEAKQDLQAAYTRATETQGEAEAEVARLVDEVKRFEDVIKDNVQQVSEKDSQIAALNAEVKKLELLGVAQNTRNEEASQEIHRLTSNLKSEKLACEELVKKYEKQSLELRSSLSEQHSSELAKAKAEAMSQLEDVASRADERLKAMKDEISSIHEEHKRLQNDYAELIDTSTGSQKKLENDLNVLRERLDHVTQAYESVLNAKNEAEQHLVAAQNSIDCMQKKIDELNDEIRGKVKAEQVHKDKMDALMCSISALESGKQCLEQELLEVAKTHHEELQHTNNIVAQQREDLASVRRECAEHQRSAASHKAAGEALHSKLQKISEDHRAELDKENAATERLQHENMRLLLNLDGKSRELEELTEKLHKLDSSLQESNNRCRNAEIRLEDEMKEQKLVKAKFQEEARSLREQLQDAFEKHEMLSVENIRILEQKEKLDRDIIPPLQAQVKLASLEVERLSMMTQKKDTEINEMAAQAAEAEQLLSELKKTQNAVQKRTQQVNELEEMLKERNTCIAHLEGIKKANDGDENFADLKKTVKELENEVTKLRTACQEMESPLTAYHRANRKHMACLRKLKNKKKRNENTRKRQVTNENVKDGTSSDTKKRRAVSVSNFIEKQSPLAKKTKTEITSNSAALSMRRGPMADLTQSHLNR